VRLGILGPLLVADDAAHEIAVGAARQRTLLAALLVRANGLVPVDELADIVWDGAPPGSAARTLRSYVTRLRHAVGPEVAARIRTRDPGYLCEVAEDELDALRFEALRRQGGEAARAAQWRRAHGLLVEALGLWRGAPLADVASRRLHQEVGEPLCQARLQALEWRIEADLQLGRHDQLVPELSALINTHPLREHGHAQLMLALYRCGRAGEALEAYRRARRVLVGELGVEPGARLQDLHHRILSGDPDLLAPAPVSEPATALLTAPAPAVVPRQLPAAVEHFTGRAEELSALSALAARAARGGGTAVVSAIGGAAGVGKTALAVHWAQQAAGEFPDGQLYVNLRGYDAEDALSAADALAGFLRALGVDGRDVPPGVPERAALFRSLLAGRRVLIVLDNAHEARQVRPLLPGAAGCLALVTSRGSLAGLVARDGAERMELDVLAPGEAVALLRALLGGRARGDPRALAALAARCCRLPLALRIAAELAVARPGLPIGALVGELTDLQRRLDLLDADGDEATAVRAVFSWSYRHLDPAAARAFRLLSLHPGSAADGRAVAALLDAGAQNVARLLDRLVRAHLVQSGADGRYGMHDLLRAYARELADAQDGEPAQRAAVTALLDHYLRTAAAAMDTLYPTEAHRRPRVQPPRGGAGPVADPRAARAWLDAERANLLAAAALAADQGWPGHATALSATVERYLSFGYHLSEGAAMHRHALVAARRSGDRAAEATALTHLGHLEWVNTRFEEAVDYQQRALALFRALGDVGGQARALHRLTLAERQLGRLRAAAEHAGQALELARQDGDRLGQARALQSLGLVQQAQGRLREAGAHLERALALFDELGDRLGASVSVKALGAIELRYGRLGPAGDHLRRALRLCAQTVNPNGGAEALSQLGLIHLSQGRAEQGAEYQRRALDTFRRLRDRHGQCAVLIRLASAELRADRTRRALASLREALELARAAHAQALECVALNALGETLLAAGLPEQAAAEHRAALELTGQVGDQDARARAHHGLARAHEALGERERAQTHLAEALALYTALALPEAEQIRGALQAAAQAGGTLG